ncbi:hypothetical protein WICPIJ_007748 [Wickerhamomyces pijperi]|uniref:Uncharacterized protein n=1 Tax=Wickerhamomyces pijperi TaxID=599730 RepID=A0A9P8PZ78_WICPI|nr:hypothetical protein WICPIJ_007748 [Wickerhamomyces pijperi]
MINGNTTLRRWNSTIQSLEIDTLDSQVITKNIKHSDHLGENQNSVAILLQSREQLVQQHHLTRGHNHTSKNVFSGLIVGAELSKDLGLSVIEKIRVIGGLLQL